MGKVFKYGANIDTDVIIPARYLNVSDGDELAKYVMIDLDEDFAKVVKDGDIVVATDNFGCGSSREHAPLALKCAGIRVVIANTFSRIFYRNSINIGLGIIECPEAVLKIDNGDDVEIDFASGLITNFTKNEVYKGEPFPDFIMEIINNNGLINHTKLKMGDKDE